MKKIVLIVVLLIILGLLSYTGSARATEIENKTQQQNEILQLISEKQLELDRLSNEYTAALLAKEQSEKELRQLNKEVASLEQAISRQKEDLIDQSRLTYKTDTMALLDMVLDSDDFSILVSNLDFCKRYLNQTTDVLNQLKDSQNQLKIKQAAQQQEKENINTYLQEIEESQNLANVCVADLQAQYDTLDIEIADLLKQQEATKTQQLESATVEKIEDTSIEIVEEEEEYTSSEEEEEYTFSEEEEEYTSSEEEIEMTQEEAETIVNSSDNYSSDVVARAYSMLGVPYSWGGVTSDGFDCSGFVSYCLTGEEGTRLGTTETFVG